ncbi:MAG: hypothetical protein O8C61_12585 [Candidatus Methanoperedens sp.]|nr:hypothetical protein [Candidatus Methanoperedens sp.]
MKLADDISDTNSIVDRKYAIPLGIGYGALMGYLMILDTDVSLLFGGVILGCLITGKIDRQCHYLALASILLLVFINGIKLSPLVLILAALAAFDEMKEIFPFQGMDFIFDYRLFLKAGVLLLVVLDLIGINSIILLVAFDLAYIITGKMNSRLIHEI